VVLASFLVQQLRQFLRGFLHNAPARLVLVGFTYGSLGIWLQLYGAGSGDNYTASDLLICIVLLLVHMSMTAVILTKLATNGSENTLSNKLQLMFGEFFDLFKSDNRFSVGFEAIRIARVTLLSLWLVFLTYDGKY
jgi:hypothetical protein